MPHQPIEQLEFFKLFEEVPDWAWQEVTSWAPFARDTLGKQLVRAIDSVGFNLVEGDGRSGERDSLHFFTIARASAREAELGLRKAEGRGLLRSNVAEERIDKLNKASRMLNGFIDYRRRKCGVVRELVQGYQLGDEQDRL